MPHSHSGPAALERVAETAGRLEAELGKVIGQQRVIREILIAHSSGGAVFSASDLAGAVAKLRVMERPVKERRARPMRSAWWIIPFTGRLSADWVLRRRRGQR